MLHMATKAYPLVLSWDEVVLGSRGSLSLLHALHHAKIVSAHKLMIRVSPIRSLSIYLGSIYFPTFMRLNLELFNLQSLTLKRLPPAPERWTDLAMVLASNPKLKFLSISSLDESGHSLEMLCDEFESRGAPPLSLVSLELGKGFELTPPRQRSLGEDREVATYLFKLSGPHHLRNLIFRGSLQLELAWGTFRPDILSNLRWFSPGLTKGPGLTPIPQGLKKHFSDSAELDVHGTFRAFQKQVFIEIASFLIKLDIALSFGGLVCRIPLPHMYNHIQLQPSPVRLLRASVACITMFCPPVRLDFLESLCINTSWCRYAEPTSPENLKEIEQAAQIAATQCLALRYIKIRAETGWDKEGIIIGGKSYDQPAIIRSWTICRKPMPQWPEYIEVLLDELSEDQDKVECPRGFWSEDRKIQHLMSVSEQAENDPDDFWWTRTGEEQAAH